MSRARARSRARTGRPPSGGLIPWALSIPARMHLRWLVILAVFAGAMGLYAHVLLSAPPMPPSQAPAETRPAAADDVVTAHSKPAKPARPAQTAKSAKSAPSKAPTRRSTQQARK